MTTEERRPTAIIADDHANVHPLLRRILEPEFDVVGSVFDGQALLEATVRLNPDLIIVDVLMPVLGGIEAVKLLKAQSSPVSVVFISTDGAEETVQRALKTGAWVCPESIRGRRPASGGARGSKRATVRLRQSELTWLRLALAVEA